MTKEELTEKHMIQWRTSLPGADVFLDMTIISIEYAISVLEDIATTTATIEGAYIKMNEKIQQLRKLITV